MDNLRGYGEDDPTSSSSLGHSVVKLPSSSKGPSAPLPAQASVLAGSSPAVMPVTSGPVPTVLAPTQPASSVPQDGAPLPPGPLDDTSPPPPPAEPYEDFMARVGRDLSTLPVHSPLSCRGGPFPCVGDGDDDRNSPTHALPQVRGLFLGFPAPGPKHQDPDASSRLLLHGSSIKLGVARTGLLRCHVLGPCIPACFVASCPLRTSWTFRMSRRTFHRGPFPCSSTYGSCYWSKNDLFYPPALARIFSGCHAPFYPTHHNICAIVQCELCRSHDDAAGCRDHFPGTYPGDDPRVERRIHGGHESLLATICWWRSTSANSGSHCSFCEHRPRLAAAAESFWRPRGVMGSA